MVTEQLKMELFDFVSNIGGTMGVFLGVSFLSFIEIFENLLEVFYILLCLENTYIIAGITKLRVFEVNIYFIIKKRLFSFFLLILFH